MVGATKHIYKRELKRNQGKCMGAWNKSKWIKTNLRYERAHALECLWELEEREDPDLGNIVAELGMYVNTRRMTNKSKGMELTTIANVKINEAVKEMKISSKTGRACSSG